GSVTFLEGAKSLGTQTLISGQATITVEDADSLGVGSFSVTANYLADTVNFPPSTASIPQSVNLSGVAGTSGNNTFTGNQTISGNVTASSFVGNGSGLTNVTASGLNCAGCIGNTQLGITYAAGDAQGGNALNALSLGGNPATFFAPFSGDPNYAP